MDSLPPEALTLICNQLPWKDKLAVRGLSTKFRDLPIEPITLIIFRMEQKENSFCFGLGFRLKREQKVIEIVKDPQEKGYTVTKAEVYSGIKSQTYQKTTIRCDHKNYDKFINLYMKHFLSAAFWIYSFRVVNLRNDLLARLLILHPAFIRRDGYRQLELYSENVKMSREELKLLTLYKYHIRCKYCPPAKFHVPADFWELPLINTAIELSLHFGKKCGAPSKHIRTVNTDLGIDDDFLSRVVASEHSRRFVSNTVSTVTLEFLIRYIENSLDGGHTLLQLALHHRLNNLEVDQICQFLHSNHFVKFKHDSFLLQMKKKTTKEGFDPDQVMVKLHRDTIWITGDFGAYRGKKANVTLNRPPPPPDQDTESVILNLLIYMGPIIIWMIILGVFMLIAAFHVFPPSGFPDDHSHVIIRLVESTW